MHVDLWAQLKQLLASSKSNGCQTHVAIDCSKVTWTPEVSQSNLTDTQLVPEEGQALSENENMFLQASYTNIVCCSPSFSACNWIQKDSMLVENVEEVISLANCVPHVLQGLIVAILESGRRLLGASLRGRDRV